MVVDRYKYMDLYPCSPVELKIMGYVVRGQGILTFTTDAEEICQIVCFSRNDLYCRLID